MRAVLVDTQGPEIRTGNIEGGGKVALMQGSTIELTTNPVRPGDEKRALTGLLGFGFCFCLLSPFLRGVEDACVLVCSTLPRSQRLSRGCRFPLFFRCCVHRTPGGSKQ